MFLSFYESSGPVPILSAMPSPHSYSELAARFFQSVGTKNNPQLADLAKKHQAMLETMEIKSCGQLISFLQYLKDAVKAIDPDEPSLQASAENILGASCFPQPHAEL